MIFGKIESGESGLNLVLEVNFVLGSKMVFIGDATQEIREDFDLGGVLTSADGKTFFGATLPVLDVGFAHVFE